MDLTLVPFRPTASMGISIPSIHPSKDGRNQSLDKLSSALQQYHHHTNRGIDISPGNTSPLSRTQKLSYSCCYTTGPLPGPDGLQPLP